LMPTTPLTDDGHTIEPLVSVPSVAVARLAAAAAAEPELEPQGDRSRTYGLTPCRPRPLQPLQDRVDRKLAHSLRLALPRLRAPASRSRRVRVASWCGRGPARASDPAVVIMSVVSMLSLSTIAMPCSGLRTWPDRRS